jgi:hypothetical protein
VQLNLRPTVSCLPNDIITTTLPTLLLLLLLLLLLACLLTAIELSLGGSNPYTSTDKTNKKKYT